MSFISLLIETCTIQQKSLTTDDYEQVESWADVATGVQTRKNSSNGAKVTDTEIRTNTDDDLFFFLPATVIKRGNRIIHDGDAYTVVKVNKLFNATVLHHLEVVARYVDHD